MKLLLCPFSQLINYRRNKLMSECEILFNQNIIDSETVENIDDLKGTEMVPLEIL